ncbi:MAG: hypothetical protein WC375_00060 [Methanomassiliicoccales archaeon]|jgi:formylmethanofuran dehydrogenase subunit E
MKNNNTNNQEIKKRLEYLRGEIQAERISMGEIAELQSLIPYIDPSDVLLLEWAGVKEHPEPDPDADEFRCSVCQGIFDIEDSHKNDKKEELFCINCYDETFLHQS